MLPFFFFGFFDGDGSAPKPLDVSGWIVEHKEQRKKKKKKEEVKQEIVIVEEAPKEKRGEIVLVPMFGKSIEQKNNFNVTEEIKKILKRKRLKEEDELLLMF